MRLLFPLAALALLAAVPLPALAQVPQTPLRDQPTITVIGLGEAHGRPDVALSTFTVLRSARTARAALDQANTTTADVIAAMRELGIEAKDLQTSGFSISPQYRYEEPVNGVQAPPEIVGYEVRNTLTVRVREIDRLGEILDRAVTLGVNQGGDISFDISEPDTLRDAARREAVADATDTAEILAEAAGVELGPVIEIDELSEMAPPQPMMDGAMRMMAAEAQKSVPIATGENTIRSSVRMVFEIRN